MVKSIEFFDILATDTHDGNEFGVAVESKKYPIAGVMFHPETANRKVVGSGRFWVDGKVNTPLTDYINFVFSEYINKQASKNLDTHKFQDKKFGLRMEYLNSEIGYTGRLNNSLITYGLENNLKRKE